MDINSNIVESCKNKKYNEQHIQNMLYWNSLGNHPVEQIKAGIYTPYTYTQQFEPVHISFLHQFCPSDLVLDYGCGIGRNFSTIKKIAKRVHAYDLSSMKDACVKHATEQVELITDDLSLIHNNTYDVVFDIQTLQCFADYNAIYEYLYMISKIAKGFYLITRSYIDNQNKANILQIINRTNMFNILCSSVSINRIINAKPQEELHAELLLMPKTQKYFHVPINNDSCIIDYDDEQTDIAFFDNAYDTYKGGQYYNTLISLAMQNSGYKVTIYSETYQPILNNFYNYELPKLKLCDMSSLDVLCCNIYFGSPGKGAIKAIELSHKYHKQAFIFLYDCPLDYDQFVVDQDFLEHESKNYSDIKNALKDAKNIDFIVLTDISKKLWSEWFKLPLTKFHTITPFVNSRIIRSLNFAQKFNNIVAISRYAWNKNWLETLRIFRHFQRDYKLHIITDNIAPFWKDIEKADVFGNRIIFHTNISDVEKFYLIGTSKLLINNSTFEGFGMWAIEALACGTPLVCYDLPSLKDIRHSNIHKVNNNIDFLQECCVVLNDNKKIEPTTKYDFSTGSQVITELIHKHQPSISSYEKITNKCYDIATIYNTQPFVFHFTSIYNKITSIHYPGSRECWNSIINTIVNSHKKTRVNKDITIFTFNNKPFKSILEICCEILEIPLIVLGKNVSKWHHNDRLKYTIDFLNDKVCKHFLHVDALDAVICGNVNNILDDNINNSVLFNAQSVCHPSSATMSEKIEKIAPIDTRFKHVNGGVFFGTKKSIIDLFRVAMQTQKYESSQPICDDCDQGKFVTILTQQSQLLQLDYYCKRFYCGDALTQSDKFLIFKEHNNE